MRVLLLKFGELFLKGGNKKLFEKALVENIKNKLVGLDYDFISTQGRYVIENYKEENEFELINRLSKVFGLIEISKAEEVESTQEAIESYVSSLRFPIDKTFRVSVNRADKKFPINSNDYSRVIGEIIFENNKGIKVDLYNFDIEVRVDIRFNKKTYVYYESVKCPGGLPYKTGGKGLLLLSGGIDSPVAGYMMAKRGMEIECLHFHSFPYTSKQAKEKVLTLAKELTDYCDTIKVHVISFTKIQEHIHMNCDSRFMITIMRRIMMRIAERICNQNGLGCIITGENLGQVASQTMESMTVTNDVVEKLPVF
ncbi:MAG: tRNA 4-thiouridine(8) synthase ThiI, partial [Clostridia bacterium]|nr:tRNA 4-thiouridine(8) synthase ThiI [Clostridia bacterium]